MKLSCCMMVKNEEHNMVRCLESIKDVVDEIIVVDTGSTDKTIVIAKEYGAIVYEYPWEDDFSLHRNQSIVHSTGDWLLILDADEEFKLTIPVKRFRKVLTNSKVNNYAFNFEDIQNKICVMNFNSHRLFRKGHIRYEGIVHNKAVIEGESLLFSGVTIRHYGYDLSPEKQKQKYERSKKLLLKRLENNLNDIDAYFYLSQLEGAINNNKETIKYSEIYLKKTKEAEKKVRPNVHYTLYRAYHNIKEFKLAKKILLDRINGLTNDEPDLDIAYAFVELGMEMRDTLMIENGVTKYILTYEALETKKVFSTGFLFTYNPPSLMFILYAGALLHFNAGLTQLKNFKAVSSLVNKKYVDELLSNLDQNFKTFGLNSVDDILTKCQT